MPLLHTPFEEPPEPGTAIELADGVLWMRLPLPMRLDHVNIYALKEADGWTLVDTGMGTSKAHEELDRLLAGPLGGKPVKNILLTHHHPDHIGNVGRLMRDQGARLITTRTAYLLGRMMILDVEEVWPPETTAFYRRSGMDPAILEKRATGRPYNFADIAESIPLGFDRIADGDQITLGGRRWQVHTGNGHAPEHATLWSLDDDLVICGDQIISSISPNIGVYPTEPDGDPLAEWLASCHRFADLAEDRHFALSGHKLPFYGLPHRLRQLIENHESALDRLVDHLKTPHSGGECFLTLFKREIGGAEYGMALVETIAHLNHLLHKGQVTRTLDDAGVYQWQSV